MPWRVITAANIQGRFTATENALLQATAGSSNKLQERLTDTVGKFNGAMSAAGYAVAAGLAPDQLRSHVMAMTVWEWLKDFPSLKVFKTAERLAAYNEAEKVYELIVQKNYGAIESPAGPDATGNWNSQNKIIGRMHPVPPPGGQWQPNIFGEPEYANPNTVTDTVQETKPGAPANVQLAVQGNGSVLMTWTPPMDAQSFNIYKGTFSGQETLYASNVPSATYTDNNVVHGTQYFYTVTAVNDVGEGPSSVEVNVTP
ncbi:MAG: fibronectin type III domain-containing protein [Patescibacteria group bacterium]|nr:fibronectin type III domain-containing protein [Patescibacteria group bacterium]